MSALIYQILTSSSLLTLGLYHLITTTKHYLKSPTTFTAKPIHPLSLSSTSPRTHHLRYLPFYLITLSLFLSLLHHSLSSTTADPLVAGHSPVHRLTSLQSAAVSFLFLLLSLSLLAAETTAIFSLLPSDLLFAVSSAAFALHFSVSSSRAAVQTSDLQARCDYISGAVSASSAVFSLLLAILPRLFVADVALAASICLQGLWALQTGFSLYVEAFIPEGCHRLLDVVSGVEGSTKCELDESKLRAVAILDLAFVIHVIVVVVLVFLVYGVVSKAVGVSRRFGSYDALPNSTADGTAHVQLKTLSGTQA